MSISNRVEEILFIRKLEQLGLMPMWDYIQRTNPAKGNAYHNTRHMFGVAQLAWKLWSIEAGEGEVENDCPDYDLRILLIACLWHDYDHSGGQQSDRDNINDAINAFETWLALPEFSHELKPEFFTHNPVVSVKQLIEVTEFPFCHEPCSLAEKVIRDADLLYSFHDSTGEILHGLYTELAQSGRLPEDVTFLDMVDGQTKFHNEVKLFTKTGLAIHIDRKAEVIREQLIHGRNLNHLVKS